MPQSQHEHVAEGPISCHLPEMSHPAHSPVNMPAAIPAPYFPTIAQYFQGAHLYKQTSHPIQQMFNGKEQQTHIF